MHSGSSMLSARYIVAVKNMRGVVVLDNSSVEKIKWLVKKFRYRNLGLTPSTIERYRDIVGDYLGGNPFIELALPYSGLEKLIDVLYRCYNVDYCLLESLVYASLYVSPLINIGSSYSEWFVSHSVDHVYVDRELGDRDLKFHLRVADYSVLDMYLECVEESSKALECLGSGDSECLEAIMASRRERIERDKKRFWRIKAGSGKVFLSYVDLLALLLECREYIEGIDKNYAIGLTVIPVVYI